MANPITDTVVCPACSGRALTLMRRLSGGGICMSCHKRIGLGWKAGLSLLPLVAGYFFVNETNQATMGFIAGVVCAYVAIAISFVFPLREKKD